MKLLQRVKQLEDENYGLKSLLQNRDDEGGNGNFNEKSGNAGAMRKLDGFTQTSRPYNQYQNINPNRNSRNNQPHSHIIIQHSPSHNERKTLANPTNTQMANELENRIGKNRELKGLLALARLEMERLNQEKGSMQKQTGNANQDVNNLREKVKIYSKNLK